MVSNITMNFVGNFALQALDDFRHEEKFFKLIEK